MKPKNCSTKSGKKSCSHFGPKSTITHPSFLPCFLGGGDPKFGILYFGRICSKIGDGPSAPNYCQNFGNCQFCPLDSRQWRATRHASIEQEVATVVDGPDVAKTELGPVQCSPPPSSGFQLKLMTKCLI